MPAPSPLGESVKEALDGLGCLAPHPAGHSQTLLRYLVPGGGAIGVQRVEKTSVRLWTNESDAFAAAVGLADMPATLHVPPSRSKPGRIAALDQVPSFRGKPLHWIAVRRAADAVAAVGLLVAVTARPGAVPDAEPPGTPSAPEAEPPARASDRIPASSGTDRTGFVDGPETADRSGFVARVEPSDPIPVPVGEPDPVPAAGQQRPLAPAGRGGRSLPARLAGFLLRPLRGGRR